MKIDDFDSKLKEVVLDVDAQYQLGMIEDLNKPRGEGVEAGLKTRLHPGQIEVLKPLYQKNKAQLVVISCGRKFGKSEAACYALWKQALYTPGSACYYIAPESSHGRKIIWDTQRLQKFLAEDSHKYVRRAKNLEMKVEFKNGSFIQVIGSENFSAANGLTPHIAVYDEFKAFHPRWHLEFAPNRVAKSAPIIIIGTLPATGDRNLKQYNDIVAQAESDPDSYTFKKTTWDNPLNLMPERSKLIEWEIRSLIDRGDNEVAQREYFSRIVPGGKRAIFPMLSEDSHKFPHNEIMYEIKKDLKKLEWYCVADPGSTTCFGVLFIALNPYTRKVYILDEIYEKNQSKTSVREIYPRIYMKMQELYPGSSPEDDWFKCYDEAAVWFANEVMNHYQVYFTPTAKHLNKKAVGISLIKDQLIHNFVKISNRCENLWNEMEKYSKNHKDEFQRHDDHLIDCYRYFNGAANYHMMDVVEALKTRNEDLRGRFRAPEHDDLFEDDPNVDWTANIMKVYP